jgi:hypothetical protein
MDPTSIENVFRAWAADVRARGGQATVYPSGGRRGYKAERFPVASGGYRYQDPPAEVMQLEAAVLEREQGDIAAGEHALAIALDAAWDWVKGLPQQVLDAAKWVAGVPRELIGSALGFPPWVVPVGLIAAAVYLVREWGRRPGTR